MSCVYVTLILYPTIGPDWSNNPAGLGQSENFGPQVDRHGKKGSPVVPGSLELVMEDNDSALYTITVLKGMYEVSLIRELFVLLDAHLRETDLDARTN